MVNAMVERATSDLLIGPDWARNIEICDMLNQDPGQAKDVVKGVKKRIWSRNSKVQLLAVMLLETLVKNCGDIVHMHVAEKEIPHELVRIVKKKPDFHVKEKILILIDTWQEAFGGPRARYPQYYAAYQELLRAGAVFPKRTESSAPVFTPPQTQPLSSYPPNLRIPEGRQETAEASAEAEYPTLSMTEIQNARGIMDVLAEMLSAIDPANKEAVRQEVVVDLVDQCRTYKQRVVHLVNSTSDESLLCQGLALNDELQKLLAKHEAIASGNTLLLENSNTESSKGLVDVDAPLVDTGETSTQVHARSAGGIIPPPSADGSSATPTKVDPKIDLLSGDLISGDDFNTPTGQDTLALVSVSAPQPPSPSASQQNALALYDMFAPNTTAESSDTQPSLPAGQGYPLAPEFQQHQNLQAQYGNGMSPGMGYPQNEQAQSTQYGNGMSPGMGYPQNEQAQPTQYGNGMSPGMGYPQNEQAGYPQPTGASWSPQVGQQQPQSPDYAAENGGSLPPPPWESQPSETNQPFSPQYSSPMAAQQSPNFQGGMHPFATQPTGNDQAAGMYHQQMTGQMPGMNQQPMQNHQGMYPQQPYPGQMMGMDPQTMQPAQMGSMYPPQMYANQMPAGYGYGYTQQPDNQYLDQRMHGMSLRDDSSSRNASNQTSMASYLPPMRQQPKGDDKLFGDLVDMAKLKPVKSTPGGSF